MSILDGLRVMDLSDGAAASLTATLLADLGADVIKSATGDPRTGPGPVSPDWLVGNRGKRLGLVGAGMGPDVDQLARLAADCHVVVADSRATMKSWGIGSGTVGSRIALLMPPYSANDVPWARAAESAQLLASATGLAANQSSFSGDPVDPVYPYLTYAHATWAATCAVAALVERERSGRGQYVTVTGLDAANVFCGYLYTRPECEPDPGRANGAGGTSPVYTRYQGADGRWFFVGGLGPKFGRAVLDLTDSLHLLADPRVDGRLDRTWAPENAGWVRAHLAAIFAGAPAETWVARLTDAGVPVTLLHTRDEWFDSEQVAAAGQRQEVVDPVLGALVTVGSPVWVEGRALPVRPTGAATATAELSWLAADSWLVPASPSVDTVGSTPAQHGPLAGLRVATLGSYVAGPYVGCLLADLGADVVKIEPPAGDPWRLVGFAYNRGARSLAVDMRGPGGRTAVRAVLDSCDFVLDNYRLGVTDRLGIGHNDLNAGGAGPATVAVTAYGDTGPLAALPGYDTVAQAAAGIMTTLGGDDEPVMSSLPYVDHTTATIGAFAAVLALLHREHTHESIHLSTSLAAAALFIQAPELTWFTGRGPGRVGGRDFAGPGPLDRIYQVADGFVRVQVPSLEPDAWAGAGLQLGDDADPEVAIAGALRGCTREQALKSLMLARVPAVAVRGAAEISDDPALHHAGVLERFDGVGGVRFAAPGRLATFSRTQQHSIRPAPGLGEHSHELLTGAGIAADDIARMVELGEVVSGGPLEIVYSKPYR